MKLSVLHISDLHRDPENPIRNDVLLDSLENDRRHYTAEQVQSPDLIIVSGDIIHGISADEPHPENKLREQYQDTEGAGACVSDYTCGSIPFPEPWPEIFRK